MKKLLAKPVLKDMLVIASIWLFAFGMLYIVCVKIELLIK